MPRTVRNSARPITSVTPTMGDRGGLRYGGSGGRWFDQPAGLVTDPGALFGGGGAGEEDGGGVGRSAGRADRYPAFVLFGNGRVLDQFEAEEADIEGERSVVIGDEERDVGEVGHGALSGGSGHR